jgi:DNA-binding transcriptional ArsR family regulator
VAKGSRKRKRTGRVAGLDNRLAQALNHPTRTEIIAVLSDRCASPSELAPLLGIELSNVSYHTRELLKLDCIEVVEQEQVRGAVKTKYRATTRMLLDTEAWERLANGSRTGISINAINEAVMRATLAVERGTFDKRTDRSLINLKMDADEQAWAEAQLIVREAFDRLGEVEAGAAMRKSEGAETFRVTVSLLAYESPAE